MKIQVGTIVYRNKETNQFENATPIYIKTKSKKLQNKQEQFDNEVVEFFTNEIIKFIYKENPTKNWVLINNNTYFT